jgi:hypothetical protein
MGIEKIREGDTTQWAVFLGQTSWLRASLFASSKNSNLSVAVEVVHIALFLVKREQLS